MSNRQPQGGRFEGLPVFVDAVDDQWDLVTDTRAFRVGVYSAKRDEPFTEQPKLDENNKGIGVWDPPHSPLPRPGPGQREGAGLQAPPVPHDRQRLRGSLGRLPGGARSVRTG